MTLIYTKVLVQIERNFLFPVIFAIFLKLVQIFFLIHCFHQEMFFNMYGGGGDFILIKILRGVLFSFL